MDMPSLRQLRTFVAAVEHGSITRAAAALHLTQPAASQQLRELERVMKVRLLQRAGGRVVPTAAGAAILEPARRAQAAALDALAAAATYRSGETGRVRLGTGATACIYVLPRVLAALRARMPGLEVVVATGNSPEILRQVREGALDAALVTWPGGVQRGLQHHVLLRDRLLALLPGEVEPGPVDRARLAAMKLILFEAGGDTRGVVDGWFRQGGLAPKPIMELGSVEAIKVLVAGGLGASVLPGMAVSEVPAGTTARALRPALSRELAVVLRQEKIVDRGLRALLDALEEVAGRPGA